MDQMLSAAQFQYFTRQQIEPSIYTLVYCISHMEALMQHMSDPAGTPFLYLIYTALSHAIRWLHSAIFIRAKWKTTR
jgi:hypothetical protein